MTGSVVIPKFSALPSGETMRQTFNSFSGAITCSRSSHHAKFGGVSPAAGVAKNVEFFVCLSVCLFITLLNVIDFAPDFAMKALEYRNDFDAVG